MKWNEGVKEALDPKEILKLPYHRVIVADEDGSFVATISEFPGCIAVSDTAIDALAALEDVALGWLAGVVARNQPVPTPEVESEYSGKLVLRLPKSLHGRAAKLAERDGVSLNQFMLMAIATHVGKVESNLNVEQRHSDVSVRYINDFRTFIHEGADWVICDATRSVMSFSISFAASRDSSKGGVTITGSDAKRNALSEINQQSCLTGSC